MKKIILSIIGLTTLIIAISSCEKDDICSPENTYTPLLVIEFYNFSNREELKNVNTLRIATEENDSLRFVNTINDRTNTNSITLPLKSFETSTSFIFIANSADEEETGNETGNIDTVTFNYENKEVFISRGCGFINNYENLTSTFNDGEDSPWIRSIEIVNSIVKNQDSTHVKIFH